PRSVRRRRQGASHAGDRPAPGRRRRPRGGRMNLVRACDACLRRTWLVARLAGWIELARHEGKRLPEVLALADELLLAAVAPSEIARTLQACERLDFEAERAAYAAAGLNAVCRHEDAYPRSLLDDRAAPPSVSRAGA